MSIKAEFTGPSQILHSAARRGHRFGPPILPALKKQRPSRRGVAAVCMSTAGYPPWTWDAGEI